MFCHQRVIRFHHSHLAAISFLFSFLLIFCHQFCQISARNSKAENSSISQINGEEEGRIFPLDTDEQQKQKGMDYGDDGQLVNNPDILLKEKVQIIRWEGDAHFPHFPHYHF
jgi:hypothetical protein